MTVEATAKAERAILRLLDAEIKPGIIVTLHRSNAAGARLAALYDWMRYLDGLGIAGIRLHLLEIESEAVRAKYALSIEENIRALMGFLDLEPELRSIRFDIFQDMRRLLAGNDERSSCIWTGCDPYTTRAVRGVEGNGARSNCGRTNKDGINFVKSSVPGYERYLALYATPEEHGGCNGCRFFLMCKGQCPGTALDGDWRNRTEHCEIWKAVYRRLEREMLESGGKPLSLDPVREDVEEAFLVAWSRGQRASMSSFLRKLRADEAPKR